MKELSEKRVEGWIDDVVGALFDPIIAMPGGWGNDLPEWLRTRVKLQRLVENMAAVCEGRELTATNAEAACYLFTASLAAPIGSDWTQIYLYVAGTAMKGAAKSEMPEDIIVESLTESQWRDLRQLKAWIYQQRIKHRKERQRGERRQAKEEAEEKELETKPIQPSFF